MAKREVKVLRGIPGAGKSTYTKKLLEEFGIGHVLHVSADHFFMIGGEYRFDRNKLGEAHAKCFRDFINTIIAHSPMNAYDDWANHDLIVVIDNTNLTPDQISPYMLGASAFGWDAEVITLRADPEVAFARNIHGVPASNMKHMVAFLERGDRAMPPYWPKREIKQ